jgi:predicted nucleotidyltransferase
MASNLYEQLKQLVPAGTRIDIVNDYIGRKPIRVFGAYVKHLMKHDPELDLLVTIEDDAILNDHIHSNILNAPILEELEILGCIQLSLFSTNDLKEPTTHYDHDYDCFTRGTRLHYSCGLVLTKAFLHKLDADALERSELVEFDIELTRMCIASDLLLVIHYPALVASIPNVESAMGNKLVPLDDIFSKGWDRTNKNNEYQAWRQRLKTFLSAHKILNN